MSQEDTMQPRLTVSMSATIGAIAKALATAQLEMGPAIKDRVGVIPGKEGKQGYQYGYATLAACFEAVQPLHKSGIAVTQIPLDCSNGVLVATFLLHESGEWLRGDTWMPVAQQTPQGYGSALTYARRYGLSALCGLASDDDDGEEASRGSSKPQRAVPAATKQHSQVAVQDHGVFARLCGLVDQADTGGQLDSVASLTLKAHTAGEINDSHMAQIKASVSRKRAEFAQANGGPRV